MPAARASKPALLAIGAGAVALLICLPVLSIVGSLAGPLGENFDHLFATILPQAALNTVGLVLIVGLGTAVIGVGTAWLVTHCRFPGVRTFEWALLLPLAMPAYIIGYAYTDALAFSGPFQSALRASFGWSRGDYWFPEIQSLGGAGLMFVLVLYPYVYVLARTAFLEQSGCAVEAARLLGRGPWSAFFSIALPLARPAIATGIALVLMETVADFATVQYFGLHTFTTAIYRTWMGMGDRTGAAQLASMLLGVVLLLVLVERWSRGGGGVQRTTRRQTRVSRTSLSGAATVAAVLACATPIVLGFVLPVTLLSGMHAHYGDSLADPRFLRAAGHSLLLASVATGLIVAVAVMLAYATRLSSARSTRAFVRVATLGYAVPGTVIAVGVLFPLGAFDNAVDGFFRASFGVSTGLLLSGSIAAVLFAYLVRFLAIGFGTVESGFAKIPRSIDDVARTLGSSVGEVARRVHVPLLRRSVLAAAVVVFVDVLKELPATLIVRPFDFDTLAVRVYQFASDERLAQASTGALVIVLIGLAPVVILTRMITAERRGERSRPLERPERALIPAE
jgi:iron(III) transport system permease protein